MEKVISITSDSASAYQDLCLKQNITLYAIPSHSNLAKKI